MWVYADCRREKPHSGWGELRAVTKKKSLRALPLEITISLGATLNILQPRTWSWACDW